MPKFHVLMPELHYQTYEVEADSPEEAAWLVYGEGDGEEVGKSIFDRTLLIEDGFDHVDVENAEEAERGIHTPTSCDLVKIAGDIYKAT